MSASATTCSVCRRLTVPGEYFCRTCDAYLAPTPLEQREGFHVYAASRAKRFGGFLLDWGVLFVLGLIPFVSFFAWGIWLIWFGIVAPRALTPGKQLAGSYVYRADEGRPARWSVMWLRQVVVWFLIYWGTFVIVAAIAAAANADPIETIVRAALWSAIVVTLIYIANGIALLFDSQRRSLLDRIFGTVVVERRPVWHAQLGELPPDR